MMMMIDDDDCRFVKRITQDATTALMFQFRRYLRR